MKLRIKGNSLRLRVTPSEMDWLLETGRVEESIYFSTDASGRLTYALEHVSGAAAIHLRHSPQEITVVVPSDETRRWAAGSEVGIYGEIPIREGILELSVEKDFACLDKSDAENVDTFPNPHPGAVC